VLFFLNLLVLFIVATPLILLELLRSRSAWIDRNHDGISFLLWFLTLGSVYISVLPQLGLAPNWHFLAP
jgi:hypothetical protein